MQNGFKKIIQDAKIGDHRIYNQSVNVYTEAGLITRVKNCFAYMFTNVGDTKAFVNGMVVFPSATPNTALGDSRSISGHVLDLYMGNITLSFDNTGGGSNPAVEIVQLFYAEQTIN